MFKKQKNNKKYETKKIDVLKIIESSIKSTMSYIGCIDTEKLRSIECDINYIILRLAQQILYL